MKLGAKGSKILKIIHLAFIAIWFGGVLTWYPLVFGNEFTGFESTYATYLNMRSIAWNVIGWGGIGSLFSGLLLGLLGTWSLFRHRWVTIKFFTVIALICFGMFFLEDLMLRNVELLETIGEQALKDPVFTRNHGLIKTGLISEALVFISIIGISVFKPRFTKKS